MHLPSIDRLRELDDDQLEALRGGLLEAGYTPEVLGLAESVPAVFLDPLRLPVVQDVLRQDGSPGAQLARLLTYHDLCTRTELESSVGSDLLGLMLQSGLIEETAGPPPSIRSRFQLVPVADLYFVSDPMEAGGEAVMGPGQTTFPLMRFAAGLSGSTVLDIGCGAGAIALSAARRGARAIGVDINPRAVELARWNSRFNRCAAEFRCGDLTAPVRGERFDLVLAQPPFVMKPDATPAVTYLHGGSHGDELAMRLIGELPGVLAAGGAAAILLDTAQRSGGTFVQKVREGLGAAPVDLAALLTEGVPSVVQAMAYASLEDPSLGSHYAEAAIRYRRPLADLEITGFHHALLFVRAPSAPASGGRYSIQLQVRSLGAVEPVHVRSLFDALDLAARPDDELVAAAVSLAEETRWIEERPGPSPAVEPVCRVRLAPSSPFLEMEVPAAAFALFEILGEVPTVGEAVSRYARLCECDESEVRDQVIGFVRQGLTRGALRPRVVPGQGPR